MQHLAFHHQITYHQALFRSLISGQGTRGSILRNQGDGPCPEISDEPARHALLETLPWLPPSGTLCPPEKMSPRLQLTGLPSRAFLSWDLLHSDEECARTIYEIQSDGVEKKTMSSQDAIEFCFLDEAASPRSGSRVAYAKRPSTRAALVTTCVFIHPSVSAINAMRW